MKEIKIKSDAFSVHILGAKVQQLEKLRNHFNPWGATCNEILSLGILADSKDEARLAVSTVFLLRSNAY